MKNSAIGPLTSVFLITVAILMLVPISNAKTLNEEGILYRVPSIRSKTRKGGCASFGHSCFGGHGKRSPPAPDRGAPLDVLDLQAMQIFRQLCTLQPEQYLRLAPVFRRLAENYIAEAEEPLPRK